jgi:P27 family predicted phage terminase small subunit
MYTMSKDLRGNVNKKAPQTRNYKQPARYPPRFLDATAKAYWRKLLPALEQAGIANEATYELVGTICQAYSTYLLALDHLRKEGRVITSPTGALKSNPWCGVEKDQWSILIRGFKELRIPGEPIKPSVDELDQFLKG